MIQWRESTNNPNVSFASSKDFLAAEEISKNCRESYEKYILETDGESLPKKGNFYQPDWSYVDTEKDALYKATWNPKFAWGVMKTPAPTPKKEQATTTGRQQGAQYVKVTNGDGDKQGQGQGQTFSKTSPSERESLARIAETLEIIASLLTEKGIERASDMLKKEQVQEQVQEQEQ